MASFKVTNEELFSKVEIDLSGITNHFSDQRGELYCVTGCIYIVIDGESTHRNYHGEHGVYDYEEDFGFVITRD